MLENKKKEAEEAVQDTNTKISTVNGYNTKLNSRITEYKNMVTAIEEKNNKLAENKRYKNLIPNFMNNIMAVIPKEVQLTSMSNTNATHIVLEAKSEKYEQLAYFKTKIKNEGIYRCCRWKCNKSYYRRRVTMKNKIVMILLSVSIILLLILAIFGFKLGNFEIPSISKIIDKNKNVNNQIKTESELTSDTYPKNISTLETTINNLNIEKEKYNQVTDFEDGENPWYETEQYDISYLWKQLGRQATKQKIKLAIDVKKATGADLYDLYFTIKGDYVSISSYIKKIEDDSSLLFRIYNFKLVPGSSDVELKCTFAVKDVRIDPETLVKQPTNNTDSDNQTKNVDNTNQTNENQTRENNTNQTNEVESQNSTEDYNNNVIS